MKWFAWLCGNTLCWLRCNYLWAPGAYCLIIKRNYCHKQHQVLAARSDISHHACSWKSNDCCSMLLRSIQRCSVYSILKYLRQINFLFFLPETSAWVFYTCHFVRHVFFLLVFNSLLLLLQYLICPLLLLALSPVSSLQAFKMNTCLLHFVAFKVFIEEQTEGELMHRINAEFYFLLHLKFSLRHSNIGRFQTCAESQRLAHFSISKY